MVTKAERAEMAKWWKVADRKIDEYMHRGDPVAAEVERVLEYIPRLLAHIEALEAVLGLVHAWWDDVYPAAIFTGVSGDEGALRVAEIRAALQRLQERQGDGR